MKYGIYYAYWERQWGADYIPFVERVSSLGFDILEISCAGISETSKEKISELRSAAEYYGITLTAGYGPKASENIASSDLSVRQNAFKFWADTFPVLYGLGITTVGGGLYSYWPVDYSKPIDKPAELHRSIESMRTLSYMAEKYGIFL
ncbi:MAG TPA: dolichol monophosphate mannose synthase, partial [Clostridiales bacterium]|nr:dolichol monophosphate mannose synthase [Clostridiales bacterium]